VKNKLFVALNTFLTPIRDKRRYYEGHMEEVLEILYAGNKVVQQEAQETLDKVLSALKLIR
ncbi:MAG: hypothetical protein WC259_07600, partial [Dehalococcoides sp.]